MNKNLVRIVESLAVNEGFNETPVKGVYCSKYSTTEKRTKRQWRACLAIVVQGTKEIVLGQKVFLGSELHFTATPLTLPVVSRITEASKSKPFLAILIDLDPHILNEVATLLKEDSIKEAKTPVRALFSGKVNGKIEEAFTRLIKTFESDEEAEILGPMIIREIFYHLLKDEEGKAIRQYVLSGSKMQKMVKAIHAIKSELHKEIDIPLLAKKASMSRSLFFKHFKEVTSMSPIQYQKRLRLLEAKRLISQEEKSAESAAYLVGYKSASQFNREYSRMFGKSPLRDNVRI